MVVVGTFAWRSLTILRQIPYEDALVILLVTVVTVFFDLAIAVVVGVIVSALVFAWKSAKEIYAETEVDKKGNKIYRLHGALFFGSIAQFKDLFTPTGDPDEVIIDFDGARVWDHSALEAIDALAARYTKRGKNVHLVHLSEDCKLLLDKAAALVEVNTIEDPKYRIVADYARKSKS